MDGTEAAVVEAAMDDFPSSTKTAADTERTLTTSGAASLESHRELARQLEAAAKGKEIGNHRSFNLNNCAE